MIVYNVERCWFPMKNDAEAYRRKLGLKPSANFKLMIETREELAALLNALMGLKGEEAPAGPEVAPPEVIERNYIEVPDYVPMFLAKEHAKREGKEIRWINELQTQKSPSEGPNECPPHEQLATVVGSDFSHQTPPSTGEDIDAQAAEGS